MFSKVARDSLRAIKETPKQENKALAYVLALGVLTVMIYSTFDHPLLVPSLAILFWFEAGALSRKIG
jgi:hypothetical protein